VGERKRCQERMALPLAGQRVATIEPGQCFPAAARTVKIARIMRASRNRGESHGACSQNTPPNLKCRSGWNLRTCEGRPFRPIDRGRPPPNAGVLSSWTSASVNHGFHSRSPAVPTGGSRRLDQQRQQQIIEFQRTIRSAPALGRPIHAPPQAIHLLMKPGSAGTGCSEPLP
jgi:hypothetical protein